MFKSLEIHNFQSHKHTVFDFHSGVNAIIGKSHSGKSVVVKAIKWICENKPYPLNEDKYRSDWGGKTQVSVTLDSGDIISRVRDKTDNYYQINEDEPLKAFGSSVPQAVSDLFRIGDINIQEQKDKHFLLSVSAGEVARSLNKIAGLEDIDESTKYLKGKERGLTSEQKIKKKDLKALEAELASYNYLDEMEAMVSNLEMVDGQIRTKKASLQKLRQIQVGYHTQSKKIKEMAKLLIIEKDVNSVVLIGKEVKKVKKLFEALQTIKRRRKAAQESIRKAKIILRLRPEVEIILEQEKVIDDLLNRAAKLGRIEDSYKIFQKQIKFQADRLKNAEEQFHKLMPDKCPLCGSKTKWV